jgi:hypothetical protein
MHLKIKSIRSDSEVDSLQILTPEQLLQDLNNFVANRIARKVVYELKVSKFPKLSGDDSALKNCWDEICVQVQDERSLDWWAYEDAIKATIDSHLQKEPEVHQLLLSYMSSNNDDSEAVVFHKDDAIGTIYQEVMSIAMNYSNKDIEKYLNR